MNLSKKAIGAWLVHHCRKLESVSTPGEYTAIRVAGKSGILLSALSENDQCTLTEKRVEDLARVAGIDPKFELRTLLEDLEKHQLVDRGRNGLDVLGLTSSAVLAHTSDIFDSNSPSALEQATITLAERTSEEPLVRESLSEQLEDLHQLTASDTETLLEDAVQIGFTDVENVGGEQLYFNGNLFRAKDVQKTQMVLSSLSSADQVKVVEANALLASRGCVYYPEFERVLGKALADKLLSVGLYELNEVSNPVETACYITKPSAFSKYGNDPAADAFDLARALVASLAYGMQRSSHYRGRIRMVELLVKSLISGNWIGPARAIGEDYQILELKKVVRVKSTPEGFRMKLLKKEIGEIARDAITQGDASEHSLDLPGAAVTRYAGPEVNRTRIRASSKRRTKVTDVSDILQALRSEW